MYLSYRPWITFGCPCRSSRRAFGSVFLLTDLFLPLCYGLPFRPKPALQEGIMLGGLLFVVCVILQFHYHDPIP